MTDSESKALHLRFGEFELIEKTFELRQGGSVVAVQPKVLDLLIYLARHRERVVTKEELLERVWADAAVSEASLSQAVSAARRALGDSSTEPRMIATVRGRGFRFVAEASAPVTLGATHQDGRSPLFAGVRPNEEIRSSIVDSTIPSTAVESSQAHGGAAPEEFLFVIMRAAAPSEGGAAVCLTDVDELTVERGDSRLVRRYEDGGKRLLRLTLVGDAVSRKHARVVREGPQFVLRDLGSSNGTWLGGQRIERAVLAMGTVFECGHTLLQLGSSSLERGIEPDLVDAVPSGRLLPSVLPSLRALSRDLSRVAATPSALWLEGEHGVGKSTLAVALHGASDRPGALARFDCVHGSAAGAHWPTLLQEARGGSLLIENIDALERGAALSLAAALDAPAAAEVRLLATSRTPYADLLTAGGTPELLSRFSGYRAVLPPLRKRIPDLGGLVTSLSAGSDPVEFDAATAFALCRHAWPGNLSELRACLSVARRMAGSGRLRMEHLPPAVRGLS